MLYKLYLRYLAKRRPLLFAKKIGVKIGHSCKLVSVNGSTFGSEPYLVQIGDHVEVAGEVCFLTHDGGAWVFREEFPDIDVFAPVVVGNNVFIGRRATILPGTVIGDNCVIGAGAVVRGNLAPGGVYAGVPARRIRDLEDYKERLQVASLETKGMSREDKKAFLLNHFERDARSRR